MCAQQNDTTVENIVPEVIFVGVETTPDEMTTTELIESDAVKDFKPEPEWAGQTRKHGDSSNIIITEDGYCGVRDVANVEFLFCTSIFPIVSGGMEMSMRSRQ